MRKSMLIGVVLLIFFLAGCKTQEVECWDGTMVGDVSLCPPEVTEEPEPEPEPEIETDVEEQNIVEEVVEEAMMSDDVQEYLDKFDRVTSVKFSHGNLGIDQKLQVYYLKGDLVKVDLYSTNVWTKDNKFDTVFLNTADKTAVGYCMNRNTDLCPNRGPYDVEYADYDIMFPAEWITDVTANAELGQNRQVDGRRAQEILYEIDGQSVELWVDDYFGMPLEVFTGDDHFVFRELDVNGVSDSDVVYSE